jgi:signal peptidase I
MSMVEPEASKSEAAPPPGPADGLAQLPTTPASDLPAAPAPVATTSAAANPQKSLLRELVETLVLTAVLFFIARATVQPFRVDGHSMDPTLHDTEFILVDKVSYHIGQPQRGDIVVFHFPGDTTRDFIKRVIGVPGDTVQVKSEHVYVNGKVLTEPYLPATNAPAYDFPSYKVPPHVLFVLGDNRNNSYDSHQWGEEYPLDEKYLVGRALLAYWPLPDFQFFGRPSYK